MSQRGELDAMSEEERADLFGRYPKSVLRACVPVLEAYSGYPGPADECVSQEPEEGKVCDNKPRTRICPYAEGGIAYCGTCCDGCACPHSIY